ncbi:hypothetical protein HHX47_DHR1001083 [Lentinula edodes]|nr:hypothetical protein HHX47_DHR1001083 [Lentinula edodes]
MPVLSLARFPKVSPSPSSPSFRTSTFPSPQSADTLHPITIIPGGLCAPTSALSIACSMSSKVDSTTLWSGIEARSIIAIGSLATPISTTTVRARSYLGMSSILPPLPTGVVIRKDVEAPRWVQGMSNIVGAARAEETPGITSVGGNGG